MGVYSEFYGTGTRVQCRNISKRKGIPPGHKGDFIETLETKKTHTTIIITIQPTLLPLASNRRRVIKERENNFYFSPPPPKKTTAKHKLF